MSWQNNDGLYVRFGTEKTVSALGGENSTEGQIRRVNIDFEYTDLAAFGTEKIIGEGVVIPSGVFLKSATLEVIEAFSSTGSTATLTLGLIDTDRSTAWDADGIDVAIAETAIDAVGDTIVCDGDLIGTVLSNSVGGYVTATVGTESFDLGGKARLTIEYYHPAA